MASTDAPPPAAEAPPAYQDSEPNAPPMYQESQPLYPALNSAPAAGPPPAVDPNVAQINAAPQIKYVDQNGNPVNPPMAQQPVIRYVDQNGNPVNMGQQPAIRYVDQFGNPIGAPMVNSAAMGGEGQATIAGPAAANIRYVDQNGNPVPAPNAGYPAVRAPGTSLNKKDSQKTAAAVFGILGIIFFIIAFLTDHLAVDHQYWGGDRTIHCGWTKVVAECDSYYDWGWSWDSCVDVEFTYSDYCDLQNDLDSIYPSDYPDFCATSSAAALILTCLILACISGLIGIIYTQKWCKMNPICCKNQQQCSCGTISFLMSWIFVCFGFIFWYSVADYCVGDNELYQNSVWMIMDSKWDPLLLCPL